MSVVLIVGDRELIEAVEEFVDRHPIEDAHDEVGADEVEHKTGSGLLDGDAVLRCGSSHAVVHIAPPNHAVYAAGHKAEQDEYEYAGGFFAVLFADRVDVLYHLVVVPELVNAERKIREEQQLPKASFCLNSFHRDLLKMLKNTM